MRRRIRMHNGYSNWDLSADRANSARRLLQQDGVRVNQVTQVRGYADQMLRVKNNPTDPSNRRISILVKNDMETVPTMYAEKIVNGSTPLPRAEGHEAAAKSPTAGAAASEKTAEAKPTAAGSSSPQAAGVSAKPGVLTRVKSLFAKGKK